MAYLGRKWDAYRANFNGDYVTLSGKTWKGFIFWAKSQSTGHLKSFPEPKCDLIAQQCADLVQGDYPTCVWMTLYPDHELFKSSQP